MRTVNIIAAACAVVFALMTLRHTPPRHSQPQAAGLQYRNFASHTYDAVLADYAPGEQRTWTVTTANSIYNLVGPSLQVHVANDGSISVPYLDDTTPSHRSGWGAMVKGVCLDVATDRPFTAQGQALYAQTAIENLSDQPFQMRYGCGPNMQLALPQIFDSSGRPVKEKFTIGQDACYEVQSYSIPARTTARFIFNIRDLYDIDAPGKYTMALKFPKHTPSGAATFIVK